MTIIKAVYEDKRFYDQTNKITLSRSVDGEADIPMVLGEVIYAIETQAKTFTTHDVFERISIPDRITVGKTLINDDNDVYSLKITATKAKDKGKE